ncbi:extracellular solute-binding protein (family 7) [Tepidimonas ignava]|uniref:Solute-binding protein n=1 Tax=Tepidimonas ignava TaxID=114249 RepID=A0A4V2UWK8_9BURK|nr:TRAP transporter substrate-binding protein DctP [Tepidimonas ignava]TCT00008.1 extracellular solute-binding protein (family 7) [Tepidimonas ignava]TSE19177.1 Solute-binding protein [Tepidimonas ignava]
MLNKRTLCKAAVAVAAMGLLGGVQAQTRVIKFANQNAKGHPIVQGMDKFAELVEQKSGGRLKVQVFAGGVLGSDQANVSALQGGTLEMASMNSGILASIVKEFAIYDFPFMFGNPREADAVLDGPFGKQLHAKLEDKGLVGLAYYELGFRHLTKSPLKYS